MGEKKQDFDLEAVYDDEIRPLMDQILEICKEHDMPMIASFCYGIDGNDGDSGGRADLCTSDMCESDRTPDVLMEALHVIFRQHNE